MDPMETQAENLTDRTALARRVQDELGENVYLCYQCVKCTSGCPLAQFFDWQPNQIMRALQLGMEDIALQSNTPWLCASCQTCTTRCPQGLDITRIMEFLTREARARGYKPPQPTVDIFNQAFMREVRLWGRAYELGLMAELKLRSGDVFSDLDLGMAMIQRSKLPFTPTLVRPPRRVKPVEGAGQAVAYYPGCSLHSTSREYSASAWAACEALGIRLYEPKGWVCCGSTPAHRADPDESLRLPLENLALIEKLGFQEAAMPCAACYNHHKTALHELNQKPQKKTSLARQMNYAYRDTVKVNSLLETVMEHAGVKGIEAQVKKPLLGLKAACYYGCLLTRPPEVTGAEHPENPVMMDRLVAALGAEVVDWSYKTFCCGATHSLTRPDIARTLSAALIEHARQAGAEVIAVACPLCHTNLDARQIQMGLETPMPVLFFTQLMTLAFGLPVRKAMLNKNLVDPRPLLAEKGLIPAGAA